MTMEKTITMIITIMKMTIYDDDHVNDEYLDDGLRDDDDCHEVNQYTV